MHAGGEDAVRLKKKVLLAWLAWGDFLKHQPKGLHPQELRKQKLGCGRSLVETVEEHI